MKRFNVQLNIKRVIVLLLAVICISAVCVFNVSAESGTCGDNLNWSYSHGTLTITGTGKMTDFNEYRKAPWHSFRDELKKVVLSDGLTSIGDFAFYECKEIRTVSIPSSVKRIGISAFFNCEKLEMVVLNQGLSSIGKQAFYSCRSLVAIDIPISVEEIGDRAFYLCESLITITVPRYVEKFGKQVFSYCISLLQAKIDAHLTTLPEWTFYGCYSLSDISLPETVSSFDNYSIKECDSLVAIYHPGDSQTIANIRKDISETNPNYSASGYIGSSEPLDSVTSTDVIYGTDDEVVSQTNTTVTTGENVTVVTKVETTPSTKEDHGTYNTEITVIVKNEDAWDDAADAVADALDKINSDNSLNKKSTGTTVTVYADSSTDVGEEFLKEIAGRDVDVEIVTPSGNSWRIDGNEIKKDDVNGSVDYNYDVTDAPKESVDSLGTDDCYEVKFSQTSSLKSEILVQLPNSSVGKNAYLYQVEKDGSHTKIQGVAVDNDANAHFFLSNIDKDTKYIVGLNVPGESADDVIIPNELSEVYGALQRLEKIEYVSTGVRKMNGLTLGQLLLIVIGILVFLSVVVGIVMYYINRQKQLAFKR